MLRQFLRRWQTKPEPAAPAPSSPAPPSPPPVPADGSPADDTAAAAALVSHRYAPTGADTLLEHLRRAGFDEAAYFTANADLQSAFPTARRAALHFLAMVAEERRPFPLPLRPGALEDLAALPIDDPAIRLALLASLADAVTAMGPFPDAQRLETLWPALDTFGRLGGRPYLLVGDSHSSFYRRTTVRDGGFLLPFHLCCTGGSAIGLGNPGSRSGYLPQLQALASLVTYLPHAGDIPILVQFGQVDLEFVHAFRRVRAGRRAFDRAEFGAFIQTVVRDYLSSLGALFLPERRTQVTILAVFPPAIGDAALARGYMNAHIAGLEDMAAGTDLADSLSGLEWPGLAVRTELHRAFNTALQAAADQAGFGFASNFDALTGGGTTLDPAFIPFGQGEEHHLDRAPTEALLSARVWSLLDSRPPFAFPAQRAPRTRAERQARTITFDDLSEQLPPGLLPPLDRPGVDPDALTPEQRSWRTNGVVELPGFLPEALVDAYVARRGAATGPLGWSRPTPYLHVPELRALALYPPLMAMMESLLSEPMMLHLALTAWISTERDWHQDDYLNPPFVASWYAAAWIALDDIGPESGPFEYLPGSHRWPLLRLPKVKSFLTEEELARREPISGANDWPKYAEEYVTPAVHAQIAAAGLPSRTFLGRKGDVLIWHGRLMHRGSLPGVPGTERRSLITHYSGTTHRRDMPDRATDPATGGTYAVFDHPLM